MAERHDVCVIAVQVRNSPLRLVGAKPEATKGPRPISEFSDTETDNVLKVR